MVVLVGSISALVLMWTACTVIIVRRLDPRRLDAFAEARRAYLVHLGERDVDPAELARRRRTFWVHRLVVLNVTTITCIVIIANAAL